METRQELVDSMVKKGKSGGVRMLHAIAAAKLGASEKAIDSLLVYLIGVGATKRAVEVALIKGRKLTNVELECLIEASVSFGSVVSAVEAAELRGRELTDEEVETLSKNFQ